MNEKCYRYILSKFLGPETNCCYIIIDINDVAINTKDVEGI